MGSGRDGVDFRDERLGELQCASEYERLKGATNAIHVWRQAKVAVFRRATRRTGEVNSRNGKGREGRWRQGREWSCQVTPRPLGVIRWGHFVTYYIENTETIIGGLVPHRRPHLDHN